MKFVRNVAIRLETQKGFKMICCSSQAKLRKMDNVLGDKHEKRCSYCGKYIKGGDDEEEISE